MQAVPIPDWTLIELAKLTLYLHFRGWQWQCTDRDEHDKRDVALCQDAWGRLSDYVDEQIKRNDPPAEVS